MNDNKLNSFFRLNKIVTILLLSIYIFTIVIISGYFLVNRIKENTIINYPPCVLCNYNVKYANAPKVDYKIPDILGLASSDTDGFTYKPFYNYRYNSYQYSDFLYIFIGSIIILLLLSIFNIINYKKLRIKRRPYYYLRLVSIFTGLLSVFIPFFTFFYLRELTGKLIYFLPDYFAYILTSIVSMSIILLETILVIMVLRKDVRKYYGLLR